MKKNDKLNIRFHNPNDSEELTNYICKVVAKEMIDKKILEREKVKRKDEMCR